ncbi:hypothetical protein [Sphingomonas abaci]|uniref:Uncharacterized protein n=1 Tax=Sphingomonas abaci TaxID=237611 RepID=A0A7W7AKZ6_9SPHN|nr:hypothetical protein [Sphingomonas abaci]MBB4618981.1 hypothetical protein [Sphingomonas abaci]
MIRTLIRQMPVERLARVRPSDFYRWPVTAITPTPVIEELIANEQTRRAALKQGE